MEMEKAEVLEKILKAYEAYYDINRETPERPFAAEASFHSHDEQFFLVKSARIGEAESNEHVFFSIEETLDEDRLKELDSAAWERGLARVKPHANHRNTDVTLVAAGNHVTEEAFALAARLKHYKSYQWGFRGFSHYRLVVLEYSSGRLACNGQGKDLKKLFGNIFQCQGKGERKT